MITKTSTLKMTLENFLDESLFNYNSNYQDG